MTDAATPSDDLKGEAGPGTERDGASGAAVAAPGRIKRVRSQIDTRREQVDDVYHRLEESRTRLRSVDVVFAMHENDRDSGGSLLGGALAFRLFLWLLPAALVAVAGLGFESASDPGAPNDVVRNAGITSIPAQSINQAARDSQSARWVALLLGLFFLYGASVSLMKALWVAHALIWHVPASRPGSRIRSVGIILGAVVLLAAATSVEALLRNRSVGLGLLALVVGTVLYSAAWWGLSIQLPHDNAKPLDLIPGAVLFGIGLEAMRTLAVYYLAAKLTSASLLYGSLGASAALLLGLYLGARIMVAAAVLNAAIFSRKSADPEPSG
jgi:uncharacterized BrkB/YihY/UPF0761 family membrane protein